MRIAILALVLFMATCFEVVQADIVTKSFNGVITTVNSGGQTGTSIGSVDGISIGDTFTAVFSYQTNSAGADGDSNSSQGVFSVSPSVDTFLSINVNGRVFQKTSSGILTVQTFNNVVSTLSNNTDLMSLGAIGNNASLPTGWTTTPNTYSTRLTFADPTGLALPSDALPNNFSPNWSIALFSQLFNASATTPTGVVSNLYIEGNLTAVPEPNSMTLAAMAIATAGYVFCGRKLRRE